MSLLKKGNRKIIKIIAFDFVGVLVHEKDIDLTDKENKLERMFGPNLCDADYLKEARKIITKDSTIIDITEYLINKLYECTEKDIFRRIKEKYPSVRLIIATNHVSYIRNFIEENLEVQYLDDVLISAEIHKIKPNKDFYNYILNKYNIQPKDLLFIDDNEENISSASEMGITTLKVNRNDDNLFEKIINIVRNAE